ncbi:MAG TPA: S9 family peptidase [Pyrinomonadaceae bacterium]|nr:S9 family peptidase [Pyrinomonadaceae bacterium]
MAQNGAAKPPIAKKVAKTNNFHGEQIVDNYFWLREKKNPEVTRYLEAENAYTDAFMKPTEGLQAKLYQEMVGRIKETDADVPYRKGDYYYYSRTEQGKQYKIHCRKRGNLGAPEEITLDLNELSKGHTFTALGAYQVSEDGHWLAYTLDLTGYRQYTLFIKDLRTGQVQPYRVERVNSVAWANDNKNLFYVTEDPVTKRVNQLHRHTLGAAKDDLIYDEKDEMFNLSVQKTRSDAYIIVTASSLTTSEVRVLDADRPADSFKVVQPREPGHEYYVDHHGDNFYIRTNENARNFRLVSAPTKNPGKENWREVLAHRPEVKLEETDYFKDYQVIYERENGLEKIRITDLRKDETHYLPFDEPVYAASANVNAEYDTLRLRFTYESLVTPESIYEYDMRTRQRELLKRTPVLGGYDPAKYQSERIYAIAADGTRVPVSLVYKKGIARDGKNPLLLYAYGSYGYPLTIDFSSERLSLLDRGVIFAQAHIRGGGDLGKPWHDQGRMMAKKNTFTDFINAAEFLIKEKYTASDRLIIEGGSAGGLLMGAVTNMRPDLFKAVVSHVPFVDVINTMMDATLPLTVGEYQEWGNPNEKAAYEYMKSYSPYDNLEAKNYPTILVKTSLNDSQVMYWEPAKYVAKLRVTKTDQNPLLLKTNMGAGHGGASGRYDSLREDAFDYAFMLNQWGIKE